MIVWFLFILLEVYRNYYMIEKLKSKPNYLQSFLLRGIAAVLHGVYMDIKYHILPEDLWQFGYLNLLGIYTPLLIFQVATFYTFFDLILNVSRKKELTHIGEANWLDRLGRKYPTLYWVVKALVALLAVLSIIVNVNVLV